MHDFWQSIFNDIAFAMKKSRDKFEVWLARKFNEN